MSTFTTSRGTRGQHVEPRFQSAPYRQHPGRRESVYGAIQPMDLGHSLFDRVLSALGVKL
jgi:hypothetical protein